VSESIHVCKFTNFVTVLQVVLLNASAILKVVVLASFIDLVGIPLAVEASFVLATEMDVRSGCFF
jgi:hypothetical protein